MRLRTLTGQRWPAKCADGCGTTIPPGTDVKVVVDFDSHPRKTWIPEHSPDAGTWNRGRTNPGPSGDPENPAPQTSRPSYPKPNAVPPAGPPAAAAPTPPVPLPSKASPSIRPDEREDKEEEGDPAPNSPNSHSGRTWTSGSMAISSVRTGVAAYARPGESDEELLVRVNALLIRDLEAKVRAVKALRERLGIAERARARHSAEGA